jgi:hypothetical protein
MGDHRHIQTRLMPYQAAFVEQFFDGPLERNVLLQSHVGMGAGFAALEIIRRQVQEQPGKRVLVFGSRSLMEQWSYHLMESGVDAEAMNGFRYREWQDRALKGMSVWTERSVVMLGADFQRFEDIALSLNDTHWDLIVVADSHRFLRSKGSLIDEMYRSQPRARMLLLSPFYVNRDTYRALEPLSIVHWSWPEIAHQFGRNAPERPTLTCSFISYAMGKDELRFRERARELRLALGKESWKGYIPMGLLTSALESSPAAFEEVLLRYRNRLAHSPSSLRARWANDQLDLPYDGSAPIQELQAQWLNLANEMIEDLEQLRVDSKLEALVKHLSFSSPSFSEGATFVLTEYRSSMLYVLARLEETGLPVTAIPSSSVWKSRHYSESALDQQRGIVLSLTSFFDDDFGSSNVGSIVFYDYPRNLLALHRVLNRLVLFGRNRSLSLQMMVPKGDEHQVNKVRENVRIVADQWGFDLTFTETGDSTLWLA